MDSGRPLGFLEEASTTRFTNPSSGLSAQAVPWIVGYLVTYFEMSKVTMKALENLYHRRRPADFLRHPGESGRGRTWLPGRTAGRWPGPVAASLTTSTGTLASRSPQRGNWIPEEDSEVSGNSVPLGPLGWAPRDP